MNKTIFLFLGIALAAMLATTAIAETTDPDVTNFLIYTNGEPVWYGKCEPNQNSIGWTCTSTQLNTPAIERGERIVIKVVFDNVKNPKNLSNVIVRAWMRGGGRTLEDETSAFDVYAGKQYIKFLYLEIPENWKAHDTDGSKTYTLHVDIEGERKLQGVTEAEIEVEIQRVANFLKIMSINLKETTIKAGAKVEGVVVVKNTGNHEIEDVYLKVTIKELGISRIYYVGDLAAYDNKDEDDTKSVAFSIALPTSVSPGIYTLLVEAYNGEIKTEEKIGFIVEAVERGKVEIVPQVTRVETYPGEEARFSFVITNNEATTRRIIVSVLGTEGWATSEIVPASFTLAPGESRLVTINLSIDKAAVAGEHLFTVEVTYNGRMERFNFITNVKEVEKKVLDLRTALLIVGIVLAAIIVVLLIILLTRKTTEEKPEESYY
ncbi:MAG: NEW3 domain-containing protein [Candidatus Pacearchaeota archaeon]|nr:NEW3 domain-containing protein [Candidatus Pacearchaeota archaeon]